jgi:hypothetical protein
MLQIQSGTARKDAVEEKLDQYLLNDSLVE